MRFRNKTMYVWGSWLSMRSFAIEESNSPIPALLATLFEILWHLRFYVFLVIIVIIVTKVIMALMLKLLLRTGVSSKSGISIYPLGHHHVQSSFGANKLKCGSNIFYTFEPIYLPLNPPRIVTAQLPPNDAKHNGCSRSREFTTPESCLRIRTLL